MFRGLLFEAEADRFQRAGIQIGAESAAVEEALLTQQLAPFSVQRRNSALEMARLYALLFCFENEIRDFIRERLIDNEGAEWFEKLPPKNHKCRRVERHSGAKGFLAGGPKD
jgi:hypothetical protein